MKKPLHILVILLSCCVDSFAQNYAAFVPSREAYFSYYSPASGASSVDAIKADSVGVNGGSIHYADYTREVIEGGWNNYCLNFSDTSWMGHSLLLNSVSSVSVLMNEQNDSIVFYGSATVGQTGMLYTFPNGGVIRGTVSSLTFSSVMNATDSIKTLTLQAYDASSMPIAHPFNGKTVQIAKTRGLVRAYNWKKFPSDTTQYSLVGMNNPQEGIVKQNAATIFDYAIGDQFDFVTHFNSSAMSLPTTHDYYTRYVTGKTVSLNGDTINYTYLENHTRTIGNAIVLQQSGLTTTEQIILSEQTVNYDMSYLPREFANGPQVNTGYFSKFSDWPYNPSQFNGRVQRSYTYDGFWFYEQDSACYSPANLSWGPCDGDYFIWADGIGKVHGNSGSAMCFSIYDLVYFSKGSESWGTPHDWSVINGTNEIYTTMLPVKAWPNPADESLNITVSGAESASLTYRIYTISGQLLTSGTAVSSHSILQVPVDQLPAGAYQILIDGEGRSWTTRFVK